MTEPLTSGAEQQLREKKHTMNTCQAFLTASRHVAKQHNGWTDRACGVLDNGHGYYAVESYEGKIVWEGMAHCRYCARAQAIMRSAGNEEAAAGHRWHGFLENGVWREC